MTSSTALDDRHDEQTGPVPAWVWEMALPALLLGAGSYVLSHVGVDMKFQRLVFSPESGWRLGATFPWHGLYHFGTLPAMLAVLVAMGGLVLKLGRRLPAERNFATVYLALVLTIGPGLVTNALLKDHWGRPRPRDVVEFGGRHAYEPAWVRDASSTGKSFPCGHATMGFFFFAYYFIHRRRNPWLAFVALGGGLGLGWLIGVARAVQGGHFLTDTWWAMGLMWFTCAGLWVLTERLERRKVFAKGFDWLLANPRTGAALIALAVFLAAVGALLATPYQRQQVVAGPDLPATGGVKLSGTFQEGSLEIIPHDLPRLSVDGNGHGMVWSVVLSGARLKQEDPDGLPEARYVQKRKGWFTELNQDMKLHFPLDRIAEASLVLSGTEVKLEPGGPGRRQNWKFSGEGTVELVVPEGREILLMSGPGVNVTDETGWFTGDARRLFKQGGQPQLRVQMVMEKGAVRLVKRRDAAVR